MTTPVYVLDGPNLNLLGRLAPDVCGTATLEDGRRRPEMRACSHVVEAMAEILRTIPERT